MTFSRYALFFSTSLAFGCGSTNTEVGARGTGKLGEECRGYDDCAPVAGKVVDCLCTDEYDAPICVAELEIGDVCGDADGTIGFGTPPCPSGSICLTQSLDAPPTCVALGGLGAPCSVDFDCLAPYTCSPQNGDGVCSLATAALGESCDDFTPRSCAPPNVCSSASARCEAPLPVGASCEWNDERDPCVAGAHCLDLAIENVCTPLGADGEECSEDQDCSSGICFFGVCGRGNFRPGVSLGCGML